MSGSFIGTFPATADPVDPSSFKRCAVPGSSSANFSNAEAALITDLIGRCVYSASPTT